MLGGQTTRVAVADPSQVGEARRAVTAACHRLGLDETATGDAALVATEAATNLVKHAGGGELLVRAAGEGLELLVLDRGPGMADLAASLRDGFSTAGTSGHGLGAIRRAASAFEAYSAPGLGTALLARVTPRGRGEEGGRLAVGAVSLPKEGETLNGDGWAERPTARGSRLLVVDGLGHGPVANEAAHEAVQAFSRGSASAPAPTLEAVHHALRGTRGAAVALAEVDLERGLVLFAGVGNVSGSLWNGAKSHHMVSLNGTAGHGAVKLREFQYPWPRGGLMVLSTDGLSRRWSLDDYPGLAGRDPALVAGVLYRDHGRGRDDVTVVVAAERQH